MLIENDNLSKRLNSLESDTAIKFRITDRSLVGLTERFSNLESVIVGSLASFFEENGHDELAHGLISR